jgi:uncharacterized protein (TIGR03067 family)
LLVFVSGCSSKGAAAKADQEKLQGTWRIVSAELAGQQAGAQLMTQRFTFEGDQILRSGEKVTYKLDATKNPKEIDFVGGQPEPAIYAFEGERLKLCIAVRGAPRPTEFASRPGVMHMLLVLERE